jgi:hypothetical protein
MLPGPKQIRPQVTALEGIDEHTFRTARQQALQVRLPHRHREHAEVVAAIGENIKAQKWTS